ncbi:MAG: hypothetical protein V7605_1391 [Acidimicrobiaceae bacterium]
MMGTMRSTSVTAARSSQASSTESRSAMSAIEHPELRSGSNTFWWSPVSSSADSAMKWTPQNTTYDAVLAAARRDRPNESPRASAKAITSSRW